MADVDVELEDRANLTEAVRGKGNTGIPDAATLKQGKQLVTQIANQLYNDLGKLSRPLKSQPNAPVVIDGKNHVDKDSVPIAQAMNQPPNLAVIQYGVLPPSPAGGGQVYAGFPQDAIVQHQQQVVDNGANGGRRDGLTPRAKKIIAGVAVGGVLLAAAIILSALGALGILGRVGRKKAQNLKAPLLDPPLPVDFEVVASNQTTTGDWTVGSVKLVGTDGSRADTLTQTEGTWTVRPDKHVVFNLASSSPGLAALAAIGGSMEAGYCLLDEQGNSWPNGKLTVNYAPTAAAIPARTGATRTTQKFDILAANPGFSGEVGLLSPKGELVNIVFDRKGYGSWELFAETSREVWFIPDPSVLPDKGASTTVSYVLVREGLASKPQALAITFADATSGTPTIKPKAIPISEKSAASPVDVDVPGKNMNFTGDVKLWDGKAQVTTLLDQATGGTWTVEMNRHIRFTYPAPGPVAPVKVSYVLVLNDPAKTASDAASLQIDFPIVPVGVPPATPKNDAKSASRTVPAIFDIPADNPGLLMAQDKVLLVHPKDATRVSSYTAAGGVWEVQTDRSIQFKPTLPCKPDSADITFVVVRNGVESSPASLKATFPRTPEAYLISAMNMDRSHLFQIEFLNYCVVPDGYASIDLYADATATTGEKQSLLTSLGTWNVKQQPDRVEVQLMAPPAITGATIYWAVTDLKGVQSSREKMTISIVKPMAKNFLLGQSVGAGKIVGANVLDDSFSQFPKDPSIVVLLGLVDIGRDDAPGGAFLRDDGKALHVPGEGSWLVDDTGMIAFQAEPAFDDAPTPVSYRFSDSKGNHSTPALILFDPALADIPPFLKALATQTDDDFWRAFRKHAVDDPKISLTAAEMVTVTQTYVLALRQLVPTELICPVSDAEYAKGYAQWDTGGQGNSDLLDVCIDLAGAATKTNSQPLAARYWGLTLMVRMLVQAGI